MIPNRESEQVGLVCVLATLIVFAARKYTQVREVPDISIGYVDRLVVDRTPVMLGSDGIVHGVRWCSWHLKEGGHGI
jgi:hypothetical protein